MSKLITRAPSFTFTGKYYIEEETSYYWFPKDRKIKSIWEQVIILQEAFPNLNCANERLAKQTLPIGADGYFAIPKWQKIATTYGGAVEKVLNLFNQDEKKGLYLRDLKERLHQTARKKEVFRKISEEQQEHDILVIPAQFGTRHLGRSPRRVLKVMRENEFDLDVFDVACMYLTHPGPLLNKDTFSMICMGNGEKSGDYCRNEENKRCFPRLIFSPNRGISLGLFWFEPYYEKNTGLATGFMP